MKRLFVPLAAVVGIFVLAAGALEAQERRQRSERGWLGVSIQDVTKSLMNEEGLKTEDGAYIVSVVEKSPADSAGLKKGDVVVEFAGRRIYDADDLSKTVGRTAPGTRANVTVVRNGDRKNIQVAIGSVPRRPSPAFAHVAPKMRLFQRGHGMLGMTIMTLNEQLAEYFGAPNKEGVLIEGVRKDGPAEKAGLKAGDVLLKIGTRTIVDVDDVHKAIRKHDPGEKVGIEVLRKGSKKSVTVEIEEQEGPWGMRMPTPPMPPGTHRWNWDDEEGFDIEIEPDLMDLKREMKIIEPEIDVRMKDLDERMKRLRVVVRERVI